MSRILVCAMLAMVAASGCTSAKKQVGPEKPLVVVVPQHAVPDTVMQAFYGSYPNATITQVQKEVFNDGTTRYAFKFRSTQGAEHEVRINPNGQTVAELQ